MPPISFSYLTLKPNNTLPLSIQVETGLQLVRGGRILVTTWNQHSLRLQIMFQQDQLTFSMVFSI